MWAIYLLKIQITPKTKFSGSAYYSEQGTTTCSHRHGPWTSLPTTLPCIPQHRLWAPTAPPTLTPQDLCTWKLPAPDFYKALPSLPH